MKRRSNKRSVGSRIVERLGAFSDELERTGDVPRRFTVRTIRFRSLTQALTPNDVKRVRSALNVSQTVLADFFGVSVNTVRAWEQGHQEPSPMALRLLNEIRRDPERFRERIREAAIA